MDNHRRHRSIFKLWRGPVAQQPSRHVISWDPQMYWWCCNGFHSASAMMYTAASLLLFHRHCGNEPWLLSQLFPALTSQTISVSLKRTGVQTLHGQGCFSKIQELNMKNSFTVFKQQSECWIFIRRHEVNVLCEEKRGVQEVAGTGRELSCLPTRSIIKVLYKRSLRTRTVKDLVWGAFNCANLPSLLWGNRSCNLTLANCWFIDLLLRFSSLWLPSNSSTKMQQVKPNAVSPAACQYESEIYPYEIYSSLCQQQVCIT